LSGTPNFFPVFARSTASIQSTLVVNEETYYRCRARLGYCQIKVLISYLDTLSLQDILMKRKGLRRRLSEQTRLQEIRIAVLGGSTTNELVDLWEIGLLSSGFRPAFYQCEYGRF
jgi:hypothetical protein